MTTCGGANSGKTSSLACSVAYSPATSISTASTVTTSRFLIDQSTMACSMSVGIPRGRVFLVIQELDVSVDDRVPVGDARAQDPAVIVPAEHLHLAVMVLPRLGADVDPS